MAAVLISMSKVDYMFFSSDINNADNNDKEKKKKSMNKRKQQEKLLLLLVDEALELAILMLVYFSTAFSAVPTELLQLTAFLIIGLVNTVTDGNDGGGQIQASNAKPNKVFSFLIDTAKSRARLSRDQIVWCMEFMIIALPDISAQLNSNTMTTLPTSLEWLQKRKITDAVSSFESSRIERITISIRELIHLWMAPESSFEKTEAVTNINAINYGMPNNFHSYSSVTPSAQFPQFNEPNHLSSLHHPNKPPYEASGKHE